MDVSENRGTPKSSNLIGISIINHPFWGYPIFGNTHMGSWQCDNLPLAGKYPAIEAFFSKKRRILAQHLNKKQRNPPIFSYLRDI